MDVRLVTAFVGVKVYKERKYHNKQVVNFWYKQHDCTAVQPLLAYLPHRPSPFGIFCDDYGIFAARNSFTSHHSRGGDAYSALL
jgi:hypothetical protein